MKSFRHNGMAISRSKTAFTLVELLVVIGIIALLISILLPSLNRAREQANMIDCQARLREMGHALEIYESEYKGLLPWGVIDRTSELGLPNQVQTTPSNQESYWWWNFTLSDILMGHSCLGPNGLATNTSKIFRDTDTIQGHDYYWVCDYTTNIRLLYELSAKVDTDSESGVEIPYKEMHQRKVTDVKRPSEVFVIWDAPQCMDFGYNAYPSCQSIDAWGWLHGGLVLENEGPPYKLDRAILPGQFGVSGRQDGSAYQKKYNYDPPNYDGGTGWTSHLRFRHMDNTTLNALCLDGHVESRKVGTVMVKDIYTNYAH